MTTVTFDTLKLVDRLKAAGIPPDQAEAVVRVIAEAQDQLVTKADLDAALERELSPIRTELAVLKWMMGVVIGGIVALIIKAFLA
ncbi:MAG: DUF1640 domain-containing protein [Chromatiales bacterium]|jgi:hypothetical protein|nr:DUF1640 domain-containing protein [Chromatiales bacterium]MDX9766625.1 DUF1640 domain-containing protein [Ectothiorhodospiraceae bacterium]